MNKDEKVTNILIVLFTTHAQKVKLMSPNNLTHTTNIAYIKSN